MSKNKWTQKELNEFKSYIIDKRKQVADDIDQAKKRAEDMLKNDTTNAIYSSHMADASGDHVELEKAYYMIARLRKYINYLDKAIEMIIEKTFGICVECNKLIPKDRLIEVPHTTKCVSCKEKIKLN